LLREEHPFAAAMAVMAEMAAGVAIPMEPTDNKELAEAEMEETVAKTSAQQTVVIRITQMVPTAKMERLVEMVLMAEMVLLELSSLDIGDRERKPLLVLQETVEAEVAVAVVVAPNRDFSAMMVRVLMVAVAVVVEQAVLAVLAATEAGHLSASLLQIMEQTELFKIVR
jgi:hypothetical protein